MRLRRSTAPRPPPRQRPLLEELEPRILFSADAAAGLLDAGHFEAQAEVRLLEATPAAPPASASVEAAQQRSREIVFVDARVSDYQALVDDLVGQNTASRQIEIFVLDPNSDGIAQISQVLAQHHNIDAVHILSHGADGEVQLGNARLNFDTLLQQAEQIQRWGDAFTANADLLIYGCDVAQHADGKAMVDALAQLTGADVAASIDLTGNAALGGDWNLEYQAGQIETSVVAGQGTQTDWQGLMAISLNGAANASNETSTTTSLTWSHTVNNGSHRALFVGLSIDNGATATEVKYGTQSLTLVGRFGDANGTVELWRLLAPTLGTANITATISSNVKVMGGAVTFNGVDQTTPTSGAFTGIAGTGTTPSHAVSSAADDLVLGVLWMNSGTATEGAGQTNLWGVGSGGSPGLPQGEGSTKPGAASVTLSWTLNQSDHWVAGGVSIKAAVNNAPVLSGANALNAIDEDAAGNSGTLVSALIAGHVSDADSGALSGIAVTAVDNANGTWQYTTNGGATWNPFGTPGASNARLLAADANTSVRFVPNANWNGTLALGITFRAWDQSSGAPGATADTNTNGGTSAFSSATASAAITVNAVNDAPQGSDNTVTTLEDTPYTFTVADFGFSDPNDSSPNNFTALRISSAPGAGTLTMNAVPVSAGQTITVADITAGKLKFVPAANASGVGYASFTFQVQDDGGTADGGANLDATPNTLTINVTAVNDPPLNSLPAAQSTPYNTPLVLSAANGNRISVSDIDAAASDIKVTLTATNGTVTLFSVVGLTVTAGADGTASMSFTGTVDDINTALDGMSFLPTTGFSGAADLTIVTNDQGNSGTGGPLTDSDVLAVTVQASTTLVINNDSQLTTEDATFNAPSVLTNDSDPAFGTMSVVAVNGVGAAVGNTIALPSGALLTMNADGTFAYDPNGVFDALAQGDSASDSFTYDVSSTSGSSGTGMVTISISGQNDAPVLSGANALNAIDEDAAGNSGTLVSALIAGHVSDADSGALSGIAVTAVDNANGTWQYTTNGGATWNPFGTPGASNARLLAADANTSVRFVPNANWNGTLALGITFRAWDQSSGAPGATADTNTNGGTSAFSSATASAAITVNAVNDAPQGSDNTVTTLEDTPYTFTVADFGFSDPNDSSPNNFTALRISSAPGAGTLTMNAVPVSAGQTITVADITAGKLKFVPAANTSGVGYASFTFQVQDDGGTADGGANLDATPNTLTINVTAVNDAPAGTNMVVSALEDTPYTFSAADFGFSDPNDSPANIVSAVKITTLPGAGALTNSGTALSAGDVVSVADINANHLVFTPVANANGAGYASFTFQVRDDGGTVSGGVDLDPTPNTLTINLTAVNDAPTGLPTISGTPTEDQTLTADASAINDIDGLGVFQYQWQRNGANIAGATAAAYTLVDADVGAAIRVQVSYTDGGGTAEVLTSAQSTPVVNVNDAPAGQPTIKGMAVVDQTLTADVSAITDADGLGPFTYQWLRDGTALSGATGDSYTLGAADVGSRISVEVRYTDAHGTVEGPLASGQTSAVAEAPPVTGGNDLAADLAPDSGSGVAADIPVAEVIAAAITEPVSPPAPAATATTSGDADAPAERGSAMEDSLAARVAAMDTVASERTLVAASPSSGAVLSTRQTSVANTAYLTVLPEWMAAQFPQFAELGGAPAADFSPLAGLSQFGTAGAAKTETLVRDLDELRETVKAGVGIEKYAVSSAVAVSTGLSVGYAAWLVRGGVLLSTLLSSMPAWRVLDPFPVLARQRDPDEDEDGDDDSLESMVDDDGSAEEPIVSDESGDHGGAGDHSNHGAGEPAPRS